MHRIVVSNNMVVYSSDFKSHLKHVDDMLGAIAAANITLSPPKCHLAYQSILLLGQKVTRLGLSMHQEKVHALLELVTPWSCKALQTFLGMAVYFSSFIPYYALLS